MATNPITPTAVTQKPSLFRQLLGGALLGLAGGLSAEDEQQAFGAGMEAPQNFLDRQMKREAFVRGQQREDQRLNMEQQRLDLEKQRTESDLNMRKLQAAHLQIEIQKATRELALLPQDRQEAWIEKTRQLANQLVEHGATYESSDDYDALKQEQLRRMNQEGNFNYLVLPDPVNKDKWGLFKVPATATKKEETITFSGGRTLKIPAGTPVHDLLQLQARTISEDIQRETSLMSARIHAGATAANNPARMNLDALQSQLRSLDSELSQLRAERRVLSNNLPFATGPNGKDVKDRIAQVDALISQKETAANSVRSQLQNVARNQGLVPQNEPTQPQLPQGNGRVIDAPNAQIFLQAAGGDPNKARELAKQYGWRTTPNEPQQPTVQLAPSHTPTKPQQQSVPEREYHGFGNIMNR